ncbi:hypothetical protein D3C72_1090290 [compost metagenome]
MVSGRYLAQFPGGLHCADAAVSPVSGADAVFGSDLDPDFRRVRPQPVGGVADGRLAVGLPGAQTGDLYGGDAEHPGDVAVYPCRQRRLADQCPGAAGVRHRHGNRGSECNAARHRPRAGAAGQQRRAFTRDGSGGAGLWCVGRVCPRAAAFDLLAAAGPVRDAGRVCLAIAGKRLAPAWCVGLIATDPACAGSGTFHFVAGVAAQHGGLGARRFLRVAGTFAGAHGDWLDLESDWRGDRRRLDGDRRPDDLHPAQSGCDQGAATGRLFAAGGSRPDSTGRAQRQFAAVFPRHAGRRLRFRRRFPRGGAQSGAAGLAP